MAGCAVGTSAEPPGQQDPRLRRAPPRREAVELPREPAVRQNGKANLRIRRTGHGPEVPGMDDVDDVALALELRDRDRERPNDAIGLR
jgi:hypothetical protein